MSEYIADPDDVETAEAIALSPTRRLKGGSTGLHPEASVPPQRGRDPEPCRVLCCFCGAWVLHGQSTAGEHLVLDLAQRTWLIVHQEGREWPRLARSRGYVEHCCRGLDRIPG